MQYDGISDVGRPVPLLFWRMKSQSPKPCPNILNLETEIISKLRVTWYAISFVLSKYLFHGRSQGNFFLICDCASFYKKIRVYSIKQLTRSILYQKKQFWPCAVWTAFALACLQMGMGWNGSRVCTPPSVISKSVHSTEMKPIARRHELANKTINRQKMSRC